jgi:Yip1 domain
MFSIGFWSVLIMAILYTGVYIFLIMGKGMPFHPWLNISPEVYYRYNVFFCAPSMILGWILSAGVVHVISRSIGSTGSFDQLLAVFGLSIGIASWSTGLHDIITSFLGAIHVISQREYEKALNSPTVWRTVLWILMFIYLAWFIILFSKGVKAVYKIPAGKATLLGIAGFLVYQFFFLIFNR